MSGIKRVTWDYLAGNYVEDSDGDFVLYSDHEAEVARLRAEVERIRGYEVAPLEAKVAELRTEIEENENVINVWRGRTQRTEAEAEKNRVDAERWQHARKLLSVDDIAKRQSTLEKWNYLISEDECKRADDAIDAAMGEGK